MVKSNIKLLFFIGILFFSNMSLAEKINIQLRHPVSISADNLQVKSTISRADILMIQAQALKDTDTFGKASQALQIALLEFESKFRSRFDKEGMQAFQTLVAKVGAVMKGDILPPEDNVPLWMKDKGSLDKFRSTPNIPKVADYVIIGAGLTGSAAAINLVGEVNSGKEVVVLEMGDRPASGASGRNGGNIEMIKENFLEDYRGFVEVQKDMIRTRFPDLPEEVLNIQAQRQSRYLLRFFRENVKEIQKTVLEYKIEADVSMNGWLRIAETAEEEKGLVEEIAFAKTLGLKFEIWPAKKIQETVGIPAQYAGRFIKESGNYHPYKYVTAVLEAAIKQKVKFYTQTQVNTLERQTDGSYFVNTNDGVIHTQKVIVATNAYTRDLFPDMTYIEPRVSHISNFSHTADRFSGMTVTMKKGDWYGNYGSVRKCVSKQLRQSDEREDMSYEASHGNYQSRNQDSRVGAGVGGFQRKSYPST